MNQPKKPAPFKNKNFIIVLIMLLMLFVMFPMTGKDSSKDITRTEFLAMMGDSTKVITELSLQKTPDGVIIEGAYEMSPRKKSPKRKRTRALSPVSPSQRRQREHQAFQEPHARNFERADFGMGNIQGREGQGHSRIDHVD